MRPLCHTVFSRSNAANLALSRNMLTAIPWNAKICNNLSAEFPDLREI
jgi:hypothetical protein